jgi:hypothetical protein
MLIGGIGRMFSDYFQEMPKPAGALGCGAALEHLDTLIADRLDHAADH